MFNKIKNSMLKNVHGIILKKKLMRSYRIIV
jgi:hypothetical protein